MYRYLSLVMLTALIFAVAACGSDTNQAQQQAPTSRQTQSPATAPATDQTNGKLARGKQVYTTQCLSCHQKNGQGVPNLNPPLVGTEWVIGDKERLIGVVVHGLNGGIEVNGERYNNAMPGYASLGPKRIAAVLTYIRQAWGNEADPITEEEVKQVMNEG